MSYQIRDIKNWRSLSNTENFRILCLGDSTTAGEYPKHLEKILNENFQSTKFAVLDAGVPSSTSEAVLVALDTKLNNYSPDMVVLMTGINDERIEPARDILKKGVKLKIIDFVKNIRIYKVLQALVVKKAKSLPRPQIDKKEFLDVSQDRDHYDLIKDADSYFHAGHRDVAFETLQRLLDLDPQKADVYWKFGEMYMAEDDLVNGEKYLMQSLDIDPQYYWSHLELGRLNKARGDFLKSEQYFKQAIKIEPGLHFAYIELGRCYREQNKLEKAEYYLRKGNLIQPKSSWDYTSLGWFCSNNDKLAQAEKIFLKSVEINPENFWGYAELSELYKKQGDLAGAEKVLKDALELNPKDERFYAKLAQFYEGINNREQSKYWRKQLVDMRSSKQNAATVKNLNKIHAVLSKRNIKLVSVQYPMRDLDDLKRMFGSQEGISFVDNEKIFKAALKKKGFAYYFRDSSFGDSGHCTVNGNRLLAKNIARVILKDHFNYSGLSLSED